MDKPTNGLDPVTARKLKRLIREKLVEEKGKTVMYATHNLSDAEELCDSLAILHRGKVKRSGRLEDIKKEFSGDKKYVMIVKTPEEHLLKLLHRVPLVKRVIPVSQSTSSDTIEIEIEIAGTNGSVSRVMKEMINRGIEMKSFYEKTPPLAELFSRIVGAQ